MKIILSVLLLATSALCAHSQHSCKPMLSSAGSNTKLMADDLRSDTIDILKTTIYLDFTNFSAGTIKGSAKIDFVPRKNNISSLSLDLLKLTVDSVESAAGANLVYSYDDTLLVAHLSSVKNIGDTTSLVVYYRGKPVVDPIWGGLYFQGGEAFNLGVGFAADPHVYGRVWFPCFDNFIERCRFEFHITSNGGKLGYCNGLLTKDTTISANRTRTWLLEQEIPSYLAAVAVGNYAEVKDKYISITGDTLPILLSDLPSDTTKLKGSFVNLKAATSCFENAFGPYSWPKIGYMIVPNGAMEHPTAVSYPRSLISGTTANEEIMAHELAHHWWGDLVTCSKQEEMWINEGMATFCQYYFNECVYGKTVYKNRIRTNHENLIHYVHKKEGGYLSLDQIPHNLTYGEHVYNKGADVAHTMRGYLGDSLFFTGLKYVLANHAFSDLSNTAFQNAMTAGTSVNMTDFFTNWVFDGGWPHFSIDSFVVMPNPPGYDINLHLKHKVNHSSNVCNNVPLEITFMDAQQNVHVKRVSMSGTNATVTTNIPIGPVFAGIDLDEKISDAITSNKQVIKAAGSYFSYSSNGRMQVGVQSISPNDSAFMLVEHNWARPDSFKTINPLYKLSTYHYWKVSGVFPPVFTASATITYDGRATYSGGGGYMDDDLIINNNQEDSIVLMHRNNAADDWTLFPWYSKYSTSATDKYGLIRIDSLLHGEYAVAFSYAPLSVQEHENIPSLIIYPNPGSGKFTISGNVRSPYDLEIYDLLGNVILRKHNITAKQEHLDLKKPSGIYIYKAITAEGVSAGKIVIR